MKNSTVFSLLTLLYVFSPFLSAQNQTTAVPSGVKYELIGTYGVDRLNQILTTELKAFSDFPQTYPPAQNAVKLYRITYSSVIPEQNNRPTLASGLLAIPDKTGGPFPVISYQHGTVFSKTEVPSHPDESMETRLMLAQFAGQGYLMVAADYFGKGLSSEPDSYLVKPSTQQACLDMLRAAQAVSAELGVKWGPLFLSGWSQGGWATMCFLNKLEEVEVSVTAAATASAPEDLFAIVNRWLHAPEKGDAIYLPALIALQVNAYERYYRLPGLAEAAFKPQYQSAARDLFLNKISGETAVAKLPKKVRDLFTEEFVAASSIGNNPYWEILQQSQAYRWRSKTPLHIYYGSVDEVIPTSIATLPVAYQKVMGGGATEGIEVAKGNHRGTFVYAVANQKVWFDSLLKAKP